MFPERFSNLPAYAFPRLRALLDAHAPGGEPIHMSIGEPRHPFPDWVGDVLSAHVGEFGRYPPNEGSPELLAAICDWIAGRYGVRVSDDQVMTLNGTREGLYNAMMALGGETRPGGATVVLMPNPFYQVYAVAAASVGAEPVFVAATEENGFLPDYTKLPDHLLQRVSVAYLCSPSNPQGGVATRDYWAELLGLAEKFDFKIFADECYSEIYRGDAPVGALQVAHEIGADPERVVIFHSLSKRSNLPGLRSGFVASGPKSMARLRQLRNYAGAPLPLPLQRVAERVWQDESHVADNRALYIEKFEIADQIMDGVAGYLPPQAGFFLWLPVADGEAAALKLWHETGVRVLPGAYLGRDVGGFNPGAGHIRVAMVAPKEEMRVGLTALRECIYS